MDSSFSRSCLVVLSYFLGLASTPVVAAVAEDAPLVAITLAEAEGDPDFAFQGEYVGAIMLRGQERPAGAQVVALGDGKFRTALYLMGLPGDGWDGQTIFPGEGERRENEVVIQGERGGGANITADGMRITTAAGAEIGRLKKVVRASPTLGTAPPDGAKVLFDGGDVDAFESGARMTEDGLLMEGATSRERFGDCQAHLEFLLPYMPKATGQGRGNSGCYLQGRYEVQILDSFGLSGKNNECGGIYELSDPALNMCFPPLVWQTYDIDYTAAKFDDQGKKLSDARITVRHNGVVVQDDVAIERSTRAAPLMEGSDDGPLYLQNHKNPVRFRNIWVLPR